MPACAGKMITSLESRKNDPGAAPLLEALGLTLAYGTRQVLDTVSFRIDGGRGTILGLSGSNGTGKSTLLKTCLGLHRPSGGKLRLLGLAPGEKGFPRLLARIGYVPQARPPGQLRLTVKEAVGLGRWGRIGFLGRTGAADRSAIARAMERAGVDHISARAVQELSGGQYQRVAIARALASEPELLLFDEPASHLDADGQSGILELIVSIARERAASMILVSHAPELLALCDSLLEFGDRHVVVRHA